MKHFIFFCSIAILFWGCSSAPSGNTSPESSDASTVEDSAKSSNPITAKTSAESSSSSTAKTSAAEDSLDTRIKLCADNVAAKLSEGTSIAMINVEAQEKGVSDYIINEFVNIIVNKGTFRVVTRQKMDDLQGELDFNMSGSVSDNTAQSIGALVGADVLITGSITPIANAYRLNIQALKTATGEIMAAYGYDVKSDDSRISGLANNTNSKPIEIRGTEPINRNSHNFVQLREYAKFLIGGEFYVLIGRANWYQVWSDRNTGVRLYIEATGETVVTYVAVHVNPKTGEVLNIVVVDRQGRDVPETHELTGGFSADEYFETKTWMEAIRYIQQNEI